MAVYLVRSVLRIRPQLLKRRALARVCPYAKGNLLAEARRLNRAGYAVPAVVTSRVAVERTLKELALTHPKYRAGAKSINGYASFLRGVGAIRSDVQDRIDAFARRANPITHGAPANRFQAWAIIRRAASLVAELERRSA